jgi:hypothetical protein
VDFAASERVVDYARGRRKQVEQLEAGVSAPESACKLFEELAEGGAWSDAQKVECVANPFWLRAAV